MKTEHKYLEIKRYILDNIDSGNYLIGEKIESETVLREKFGVSRMTVRQAINELQNENILVTIKGKGTFVQAEDLGVNGAFLMSFSEQAYAQNVKCTNKIVNFSQVFSNEYQNNVFSFSKSKPLWDIRRIRYMNGLPAAYEESFIPVEYIPTLTIENLDKSLFDYLDENNLALSHANQKVMAVLSNEKTDEYLELQGEPIMKVVQRCFDYMNNCIELCYTYYHPVNYHSDRVLVRKKPIMRKEMNKTKVLFISDNGMMSNSLELKLSDYITKNKLHIDVSFVDFRKLHEVIEQYEFVLLEPKYRYAFQELVNKYPHIQFQMIEMQDFAIQNVEEMISMISKYIQKKC